MSSRFAADRRRRRRGLYRFAGCPTMRDAIMTVSHRISHRDGVGYSIVIRTVGRESLWQLLYGLDSDGGPRPDEVVVVDDRPGEPVELALPLTRMPVTVLRSGGIGPAAAGNCGWQHVKSEWIVFLNDDVATVPGWRSALAGDLGRLDATVGGSQGRVRVLGATARVTDDYRRAMAIESAQWVTVDMAYRRRALMAVGGFDPRLTRTDRADADLGLRVTTAGYRIVDGGRLVVRPLVASGTWQSVAVAREHYDDTLMRRKHGPRWRRRCGGQPSRLGWHGLSVALGVVGAGAVLRGGRGFASACFASWSVLTVGYAGSRIRFGPTDPAEVVAIGATSVVIPFAAVGARLAGAVMTRRRRSRLPAAVLFDRDDTLIVARHATRDRTLVAPMPGVVEALSTLRRAGVRTGVITSRPEVGGELSSTDELAAVNARVDDLLGPFDTWQACTHDSGTPCACRKPNPGLIFAAARDLGVSPRDCVVIGDIGTDVEAAARAGAAAVLVPTSRTRPVEVTDAAANEFAWRPVTLVRASVIEAVAAVCGDDQ